MPKSSADCHWVASSTEVPSPHSFQVVMSCQGSFDATISATAVAKAEGERAKRGVAESYFQ